MVKKCLLVVAGFSLRYIVVVVSFFFCIGITNVEAITRTWDGGIDADTNWSTPNNWSGDTIPASTNENNEEVELKIWDLTAGLVRTIRENGTSSISWDGKNEYGDIVEGGVYIWQLRIGNNVAGKGTVVVAK